MKLLVKSKPELFYRAKMQFTRQPVTVDVDADTATVLMNENMLVVDVIKEPEPQNDVIVEPQKDIEVKTMPVTPNPPDAAKIKIQTNTGKKVKKK